MPVRFLREIREIKFLPPYGLTLLLRTTKRRWTQQLLIAVKLLNDSGLVIKIELAYSVQYYKSITLVLNMFVRGQPGSDRSRIRHCGDRDFTVFWNGKRGILFGTPGSTTHPHGLPVSGQPEKHGAYVVHADEIHYRGWQCISLGRRHDDLTVWGGRHTR